MTKILGEGRFPEHGRINDEVGVGEILLAIDQGKMGENVHIIPISDLEGEKVVAEIMNFENRVNVIIENIVQEAIQTYLSYRAETPLPEIWAIKNDTRRLIDETLGLQNEMVLKAHAIQATFDHMENTIDLDEYELGDNYLFDMLYEILEPYKEVIFSILVQNEERIKQRFLAPKKLRRRKNAKKRSK